MTGCSITASQASAEDAEVAYISRLIAGCFRFFTLILCFDRPA
jgi:hypothetical protein